ncbi:hypothetical protein Tco_0761475 [Tanacetum coccineum]
MGGFVEGSWPLISSERLASHYVVLGRLVINKSLLGIFHAILSVIGTTTNFARRSDFVYLDGFGLREMSFHHTLDLIFELDKTTVRCTQDIMKHRDSLDRFSEVSWVIPTFIVIEGEPCDRIDIIIEDLDLEPKIDAIVRDFLERSLHDSDGVPLESRHGQDYPDGVSRDSDKPKGNNVVGPLIVNMVEHNNSSRYNDNKGKGEKVANKANGSGTNGSMDGSTNSLNGQNMLNKSFQVYYVTYVFEAYFVQDDDVAWWVDSGATSILHNKMVVIVMLSDGLLIWMDEHELHHGHTNTWVFGLDIIYRLQTSWLQMDIKKKTEGFKHKSNGIAISQSHYIEKVLKKFNYFDCTPVSNPMDTSEKLMPNNGQAVSQLEYSRVISCLMYVMTCTMSDIAFVVGKLSRLTYTGYLLVLDGYTDASWISNTEDNSSTSGWVFLLALAAAGKKAECAATLAKAYSQMYNGKSRHLGVRHSMIRELITNRLISIEFVRSQQNLVDHLIKGLARDLVIKSAEGIRLNELKHVYLHIISRMCLEPAEKEDEVFTSQWTFGSDDAKKSYVHGAKGGSQSFKGGGLLTTRFVIVKGIWLPSDFEAALFISFLLLKEHSEKKSFGNIWVSCLDGWNVGSIAFNSFISAGGLVEVPSGGYSFTWVYKSATKMSKLDRFLISEDLMSLFCSWCERLNKDKNDILKNSLKKKIADIDALLDNEIVSPESMADRSNAMNDLINLEKIESIELAQKAKLKCSIEGDENSNFFHGCINKKRNNMAICGVIVDGQWIEHPLQAVNFQLYVQSYYADDVVFIGQWSNANLSTIIHVLECFFRVSGLRINLHKLLDHHLACEVDSSVDS